MTEVMGVNGSRQAPNHPTQLASSSLATQPWQETAVQSVLLCTQPQTPGTQSLHTECTDNVPRQGMDSHRLQPVLCTPTGMGLERPQTGTTGRLAWKLMGGNALWACT